MLFEPEYPFTPGHVCVVRPLDKSGSGMPSSTLATCMNELSKVAKLPVHQLIKHFGPLLPAPLMDREDLQAEGITSDQLSASCLNYSVLSNVGSIKIQFVSSLGLHLEFDKGSETLKIFQSPCFCFLVCLGRHADVDRLEGCYLQRYTIPQRCPMEEANICPPFSDYSRTRSRHLKTHTGLYQKIASRLLTFIEKFCFHTGLFSMSLEVPGHGSKMITLAQGEFQRIGCFNDYVRLNVQRNRCTPRSRRRCRNHNTRRQRTSHSWGND